MGGIVRDMAVCVSGRLAAVCVPMRASGLTAGCAPRVRIMEAISSLG